MADGLPAASISKWTGLYRSADPFALPPGAMQVADNVVIPGPSLLEPRRGFRAVESVGVDIASLGQYTGYLMFFSSHLTPVGTPDGLFHLNVITEAYAENTRGASTFDLEPALLSGFNGGSTTQTRTRFFTANGNFYATCNFGLARLTGPTGTWLPAIEEVPFSFGFGTGGAGTVLPALSTTVPASDGILYTYGSQVGYRTTYRYTDANGNAHRSAPSSKQLVRNLTGTAIDVATNTLPGALVLPGTVVELWRTFTAPIPSDKADTTGEEYFKVFEQVISNPGSIQTGSDGYLQDTTSGTPFFSHIDKTPNTPFLVEPLYTNPTTGDVNGLGIGNANNPPPASLDCFVFKGRTYFVNTEEVETLTLQIIGTGTGGIVDGDTFVLDGTTYTFKDIPTVDPRDVQLYRTGGSVDLGSITANLQGQAVALAYSVNANQGATVKYLTGSANPALNQQVRADSANVNGLGGYIVFRRLVPGLLSITATAGTGSGRGWSGALGVNNVSDSNRQPANLMQSHPDDPESVPVAFTNTVGRLELPIIRGIALRDTALLFKGGGDGLWKFTDDGTGTLAISPLDQTVNLIAPETVVGLDNTVFCFTDKGVLQISDGGAPVNVSNDKIQDDLAELIRYVGVDTMSELAFAVGYESERTYVLCLPEGPNANACTVQYIYNLQTDAWTRWTLPDLSCGFVSPFVDDVLCFGLRPSSVATVSGNILIERKTRTAEDYVDWETSFTILTTVTGTTVTVAGDGRRLFHVGDFIQYQPSTGAGAGQSYLARVVSESYSSGPDTTAIVVDQTIAWISGDHALLKPGIPAVIELLPLVADEPLLEKQWQNVYLFFRYSNVDSYRLSYSTEKQAVPVEYPLDGTPEGEWLYDETLGFGLAAWGSRARNVILKLALDQAAARSAELTLRIEASDALARWQLSALRIPFDPATSRVVR